MQSRSTSDCVGSPSIPKYLRKSRFVDFKLQGMLVARVVLYWLGCQFMTAVLLYGLQAAAGGEHIAENMSLFYCCALFGTLGFLPLALYDLVRLTHRFAGPMLRLRRTVHDLGRGEQVEPIRFRDGDFWQDLPADFNAVLARLQRPGGNRVEDASLAPTRDADLEAVGAGSS